MIIEVRQSNLIPMESSISYLSEHIFKELKLSMDIPYQINVGLRNQETFLKPFKDEKETLYLSPTLLQDLLLFEGIKTNIWLKDRNLYLGPVIGMFVKPQLIERINNGYSPRSPELFSKANEDVKTILYFFSFNQIDWISKKIDGYVFHPSGEWKNYDLPLPNIINDQCSGYKKEEKELVLNVRKQFKEVYRIPFINQKNSLGKHELHHHLSQFPEMRKYLPKTVEYHTFSQLMKALRLYSLVFLKAFQGSRGETIMSIEKKKNHYVTFYYVKGKMKKRMIQDKNRLKRVIEAFIKGKKYVIQQGIPLIKYEGHRTDVRVLLQKNSSGNWSVSGMFANIAFRDSTITNYYEAKEIHYRELYPKFKGSFQKAPTYEEIAHHATFFVRHIEKAFGEFGELGLDIAIDQNGGIWFIEANTMPDRYVGYLEETEEESLSRFRPLLEYSKFLMGCDNYD